MGLSRWFMLEELSLNAQNPYKARHGIMTIVLVHPHKRGRCEVGTGDSQKLVGQYQSAR